jgi:hypothetical protein
VRYNKKKEKTMSLCPACSEEGISPRGTKSSKYLIVFNKPYNTAAIRSWKDKVTGLDVLRKEFQKVGLDLNDFRMAHLWLHEPTDNLNCYEAGKSIVLDEAKGKQAIILVGSEPCEEFTGMSASDVYGLQVDSVVLSAPTVFVIPKPESVFVQGSGIGELRLSIQKFGKLVNNE